MCFTDEYNVLRPMDERKPTGLSLSVSANLCTVPCFICTTTTSIIALHLQVSYKHLHHLAFVAEFPFLIFLANQRHTTSCTILVSLCYILSSITASNLILKDNVNSIIFDQRKLTLTQKLRD